jgi:hypothetical protein
MALETELATYRRLLPQLLADPTNVGRYALIQGETLAGLYPTIEECLYAGCDKFGLEPFMAKKVVEKEEVVYFSRNLTRPQ